MKTEIKDVIHFYVGCEVFGTYLDNSGSKGILTGVTNGGYECEIQFFLEDGINVEEDPVFNEVGEIKLNLRPLSSMTEEEKEAYETYYMSLEYEREEDNHAICDAEISAQTTRWLISRGFDMFNLIENGLALDATKQY